MDPPVGQFLEQTLNLTYDEIRQVMPASIESGGAIGDCGGAIGDCGLRYSDRLRGRAQLSEFEKLLEHGVELQNKRKGLGVCAVS